jgi:hypothetical protein
MCEGLYNKANGKNRALTVSSMLQQPSMELGSKPVSVSFSDLMNFKIAVMCLLLKPSSKHKQLKNCNVILARLDIFLAFGPQWTHSRTYSGSSNGRDCKYSSVCVVQLSCNEYLVDSGRD